MTKKKHYDEHGNRIRSRPSKPLYKKWSIWVIVFLGAILSFIGIYTLNNEEKSVDDLVEKEELKNEDKTPNTDSEHVDSDEESAEKQTYTYEDFKGTYVTFKGEPYQSPIAEMSEIVVIEDGSYQTFNRWDFDMTSTVKDKTIEDNVLTLNLDSYEDERWGLHSESGTEQFELRYEGDQKILYSITNDNTMYSMSKEDLQTHYTQSEIDYARILMTIYGEPSLDQWAVWESEWDELVIKVSQNSAGDPTEVSNDVPYPENVTHLDLTSHGMAAGIVTYSSPSNGKIIRYSMPLHYHQEDQSEESYRQLAEEALDDADANDIKLFDSYTVADFIGYVEFVYD